MKLSRRQFVQIAAAAAAQTAYSPPVLALPYPARPVHFVVGFPPGGASDMLARLIGQSLSEKLGQQFVVENRPGASSNIATESVVHSPPDGYTLLLVNAANAINVTLYKNLNFDFTRDIAPVAGIIRAPLVMVVNSSFPAKTIAEFIAYARINGRNISMATAGNGSSPHVAGELFKMMSEIKLVDVPYRGGSPALMDLLGNQVQVMFSTIASSIGYIRSGKLRAIGVTTAKRSEVLPGVPTIGEHLPGYEASDWYGIGAPKGTPVDIVDMLNREVNLALTDAKLVTRLADVGGTALIVSTSNFKKFVAEEVEKWGHVVKFSGAQAA